MRTRAFEVNPFLHFLSSTKLLQISPTIFRSASRDVRRAFDTPLPSPLEDFSTFSEGNRWQRWLFPLSVLRSYEAGKQANAQIDGTNHSLIRLALIGAAMDCCNAHPDGKCVRYHKNWKANQATASRFVSFFEHRCDQIASDLSVTPLNNISANIMAGDARKLLVEPSAEKFNLCVTSPPYLNSFDYSDVYRPELFLGEFVKSTEELMKIRLKTVRSHIQAVWENPKSDLFGNIYEKCITDIRESDQETWSSRIPSMIQAYFEDMQVILRGLREQAEDSASVWLVVSTSAYAGVEVPVDLIIAEIGQSCGWFLREVGVLRYLRSSSQHFKHVVDKDRKAVPLRESVVIFDASIGTSKKRKQVNRNRKTV